MIHRRTHFQIAPVVLIASALAVVDWRNTPDKALFWALALVAVAGVWAVVIALEVLRPSRSVAQQRSLAFSGLAAELMLALALAIPLLRATGLDSSIPQRALGVIIGVVLAAIGNTVPKVVVPLMQGARTPAQIQSLQRFCGWSFTLAGLGYAGLWLALPLALAETSSLALCAAAVVLVAVRYGWAFRTPSP